MVWIILEIDEPWNFHSFASLVARRCKLPSLRLMNLKTRFDSAMDMHVSSFAACVCFSWKNPHNFCVKSVRYMLYEDETRCCHVFIHPKLLSPFIGHSTQQSLSFYYYCCQLWNFQFYFLPHPPDDVQNYTEFDLTSPFHPDGDMFFAQSSELSPCQACPAPHPYLVNHTHSQSSGITPFRLRNWDEICFSVVRLILPQSHVKTSVLKGEGSTRLNIRWISLL